MSDPLRSLRGNERLSFTKNEQMSELLFFWQIAHLLIFGQKTSDSLGKPMSEIPALITTTVIVNVLVCDSIILLYVLHVMVVKYLTLNNSNFSPAKLRWRTMSKIVCFWAKRPCVPSFDHAPHTPHRLLSTLYTQPHTKYNPLTPFIDK